MPSSISNSDSHNNDSSAKRVDEQLDNSSAVPQSDIADQVVAHEHFQHAAKERMTHTANDRLPHLPWLRIWGVAFILTICILGTWEMLCRRHGFRPMLSDDAKLWCWVRSGAARDGQRSVAILGSSRGQTDINTKTFARETGVHPAQLAIVGSSPVPVLADLADDPTFRGTVICEIFEDYIPPGPGINEDSLTKPLEFAKAFHKQNVFDHFNFALERAAWGHLALRHPALDPRKVLKSFLHRAWPKPNYITINPDRSRPADFKLTKAKKQLKLRLSQASKLYENPSPTEKDIERGAQQISALVKRVKQHGGEVIFVRFPTSGPLWQLTEKRFPKARYWDLFAREVGAPTVHFKDYPSLANFNCPDGSHLDKRDIDQFTTALIEVLRTKSQNPALAAH